MIEHGVLHCIQVKEVQLELDARCEVAAIEGSGAGLEYLHPTCTYA